MSGNLKSPLRSIWERRGVDRIELDEVVFLEVLVRLAARQALDTNNSALGAELMGDASFLYDEISRRAEAACIARSPAARIPFFEEIGR